MVYGKNPIRVELGSRAADTILISGVLDQVSSRYDMEGHFLL